MTGLGKGFFASCLPYSNFQATRPQTTSSLLLSFHRSLDLRLKESIQIVRRPACVRIGVGDPFLGDPRGSTETEPEQSQLRLKIPLHLVGDCPELLFSMVSTTSSQTAIFTGQVVMLVRQNSPH